MAFRDYYEPLRRAVVATYEAEDNHRQPVGTHKVLAWIQEHEEAVVEELRGQGYDDAEDPKRRGWSWRQYLGNALSRLSREGGVLLVGHTKETPRSYFGPVGLWKPAERSTGTQGDGERLLHVRIPASLHERLGEVARKEHLSVHAVVEDFVEGFLGPDLAPPLDTEEWLAALEAELDGALREVGLSLPLSEAQSRVIEVAMSLAYRIAGRLDRGGARWSVCAKSNVHDRTNHLEPQTCEVVKRWGYEEGNDITIFTQRDDRAWPLLAVESEAANWYEVGPEDGNDYLWDFYKLYGSKAFATLFLGRVGNHDGATATERMEKLAETFEARVYQRYRHLLRVGQPVLVVLIPQRHEARALVGAAVNPSTFLWRWTGSAG